MKEGDIIDNYRRLPIGKYIEICNLCKEDMEDIDRQVKIIAILADMDEEDILRLPLDTYKKFAAKSKFLEDMKPSDAGQVARKYIVGEFELVPVTDHRKINTAQYIDFQEYSKKGEDNLVEILSCMLVPKGRKYNQEYDVMEVQKAIRENMPVSDVLALIAFFFVSWHKSIADFLSYSMKEARRIKNPEERERMMERIKRQETLFRSNGVG